MGTTITISQTNTGWRLLRQKDEGTEKGEVQLASSCGGVIGQALIMAAAKVALNLCMADNLHIETYDPTTAHEMRELVNKKSPRIGRKSKQ